MIDPNKDDLIYAGSIIDNELKIFRYTQNQRRKEMRTKKHRKIRMKENKRKTFADN